VRKSSLWVKDSSMNFEVKLMCKNKMCILNFSMRNIKILLFGE
jgi:hypothetical protein